MNIWQMIMLVGAGILGGMANAMAGGASLFTFPAMLATGLPAITANASNAFSLLPANSLAAFLDREKLPQPDKNFALTGVVSLVGGVIGAFLLLTTPAKLFSDIVPALIGLATAMFIFSKAIRNGMARLIEGHEHPRLRAALVFVSGIYGGYFGAGLGVVLMAVLSATAAWELRTTNAFKNVLGFLANLSANMIFVWQGVISWPETLTMMVGTAIGGFAGAKLVKVLPAAWVRNAISAAGVVMTVIYVKRYWL